MRVWGLFVLALLCTASVVVRADDDDATVTKEAPDNIGKPAAEDLGDVIGIDLGTTYSCVAVAKDGRIEIIANEQGNRITPSYVAFLDDGSRVVGDAAKNQASMNPTNTVFDVKRLIGRRYKDKTVQYDKKLLPYTIVDRQGKPYVEVEVQGKTKQYAPEEISAMILTKMKQIAETYLGHTVKNAVVTCPAYFNDAQRQATKDAGTIAGLNVMRVINEPTAAALSYGLHKRKEAAHNILVFDLGGGTFDVTVLTIDDGVFEVQATNGDTHLGGEDFDQRIVEYFLKVIQQKYNKDLSKDLRALSKLRREAEKSKRALSSVHEVRVEIDALFDDRDFSEVLTRAKFEELNKDLFEKTLAPVGRVLKDAGLKKTDIGQIVLVGGSTRIPKVQELLKAYFDGKELNKEINPDEAVAYGAAVQGGIFSGKGSTTDVVLLDVTPMSLGTAEVGGIFSKIIERNSVIPTKKSAHYTTVEDDQEILTVEVYQGERVKVKNNIFLGKFDLQLEPQPRGVPDVKVTFEIDANGILHVDAVDLASGNSGSIVITPDKGRLSEEEIARMTEEAKAHEQEDKLFQEKFEAKRELEDHCYKVRKDLDTDKTMKKVYKKQIKKALNDALDWLDEVDIDTVGKKVLTKKLSALKNELNPIFKQARKDKIKPKAKGKGKDEPAEAPEEEEEEEDEEDLRERKRRERRRGGDDDDDDDFDADVEASEGDDSDQGPDSEFDLDKFAASSDFEGSEEVVDVEDDQSSGDSRVAEEASDEEEQAPTHEEL